MSAEMNVMDNVTTRPEHHPAEEFLLDYATGGQTACESLMMEAHLALCPICTGRVRSMEAIGGALLDSLPASHLPPAMLNRTLAAIDMVEAAPIAVQPAAPVAEKLDRFMHEALRTGKWRRLPGGFRMRQIAAEGRCATGDGRVWLCDAPAGMRMLPHRHAGDEWTVVLSGEIIDSTGRYGAGDFICSPDGLDHRPVTGTDGRCISLTMVRESPRYTTAMGKLAAPFIRL